MENQDPNYQPRNRWKIFAILLAVLSVILAVTTTLLAIKSIHTENVAENQPNSITDDDCVSADSNCDCADNGRYLTVDEWGLRFEIPEQFSELSYKMLASDEGDSHAYFFNDSDGQINIYGNLQYANGHPALQFTADDFFAMIVRYDQENDPIRPCPDELCDNGKIGSNNGYNYYFIHRQDFLSPNNESLERIAMYLLDWMAKRVFFI